MNELKAEIAKQSKIILILAKVARIILYVMAGCCIAALVASFLSLPDPLFVLFGVPIKMFDLTEGLPLDKAREELLTALLQIGLAEALLYLITDLFRHIQGSDTPFTEATVKKLKAMSVMLGAVVFIDNGYLGVVVAFIGYAIALIFQYGCALQQQVDETL